MEIPIKQIKMFVVLLSILGSFAHANNTDTSSIELLKAHRGQVVLLDFWASWCTPCRRSFPWMNEMKEKYQDQGLVVIAINMDADRQAANNFLSSIPAEFDVPFDQQSLATQLEVAAMPTSFIIGRNGQILNIHRGFLTKKITYYEETIRRALKSK